jgi:hypothetical protein
VGEQRGIAIGEERGEARGEQRGEARGIVIGEERGEQRARRQLVLHLFRQRFKALNSSHEAMISNASPDELERLVNNLFTIEHPDELLTGQADPEG